MYTTRSLPSAPWYPVTARSVIKAADFGEEVAKVRSSETRSNLCGKVDNNIYFSNVGNSFNFDYKKRFKFIYKNEYNIYFAGNCYAVINTARLV